MTRGAGITALAVWLLCAGGAWALDVPAPPLSETTKPATERIEVGPFQVPVTIYHARMSPAAVRAYYERALKQSGWQRAASPVPLVPPGARVPDVVRAATEQIPTTDTLTYRRGRQAVSIWCEPEGSGTVVIIGDMSDVARTAERALREPRAPQPVNALPATAHDAIDGFPVYARSTRLMAQGQPADGSWTRMYETADEAATVMAFYMDALTRAGWSAGKSQDLQQPVSVPEPVRAVIPAAEQAKFQGLMLQQKTVEFRRGVERAQVAVIGSPSLDGEQSSTMIAVQWVRMPSWTAQTP